ncbi:hypothetical protein Ancab_027487 [Ancistrocladus abbreviatus]
MQWVSSAGAVEASSSERQSQVAAPVFFLDLGSEVQPQDYLHSSYEYPSTSGRSWIPRRKIVLKSKDSKISPFAGYEVSTAFRNALSMVESSMKTTTTSSGNL